MFKTTKSKIGFGLIVFGFLAMIVSQTGDNTMSIGQSIFVGGIFVAVGAVILFIEKKKAPAQTDADAESEDPLGKVYVYPGSKVYHLDWECSYSYGNDAEEMSEEEAIQRGYRKCKKCQNFTGII